MPSEPKNQEGSRADNKLETDAETLEVRRAAWVLARFFDGVVMDAEGNRVPHPSELEKNRVSENRQSASNNDSEEILGQLELFSDLALQPHKKISLDQLRQWYLAAKALNRPIELLERISFLGKAFREEYGAAKSNVPHPFGTLSDSDVEQWQKDVASQMDQFEQQEGN